MKQLTFCAAVGLALMGCVSSAHAQRSNLYFFVAPGAETVTGYSRGTLQAGGGGEFAIGKGFGAGVEASGLVLTDAFLNTGVFVFSPNAYYHLLGSRSRQTKFDPFVTGVSPPSSAGARSICLTSEPV